MLVFPRSKVIELSKTHFSRMKWKETSVKAELTSGIYLDFSVSVTTAELLVAKLSIALPPTFLFSS